MKKILLFLLLPFLIITGNINAQVLDTLKVFNSKGSVKSMQITEDGIKSNYVFNFEYDNKNRLIKEFISDTLGKIQTRIGLSEIIVYEYKRERRNKIKTIIYLDKKMNPTNNDRYGFHKIKTKFNRRQLKIEEWFFKLNGQTFQRISFKYNKKDLLTEVNYLDSLGNLKNVGLAIVLLEYDDQNRVIKESNFDFQKTPYNTYRNPFITQINYVGGIECKKYFDSQMNEIKSTKLSNCEPIPNIQLLNKDGKLISLNEKTGKVKVIHFWATWSRPCKEMNKKLVKLVNKIDTNEVEIISIALEKADGQKKWENTIKETNLNWEKHLCDFKHWKSKGAEEFGVQSIPKYFVIDENGLLIGNGLILYEVEELLIQKNKM